MNAVEWIALGKIVFGGAGLLGAIKFGYNKYQSYLKTKKRKKELNHTIDSFKNIEKIFNNLNNIGQDFDCNYVHLLTVHNGGKAMNELSEKRITIKAEYKADKIIPKIKGNWQNRDMDFDWFPILNKVLDQGSLHIPKVEDICQENSALRMVYNANRGEEFFIGKIGWVADSLLLMVIQRDNKPVKLTTKQQAFLTYKSQEFMDLFSNAKYFLE